jgi:hypothetical protein
VSVKGFVPTGSYLSPGTGSGAAPPESSPAELLDVPETAPLPPLDVGPEPALGGLVYTLPALPELPPAPVPG